MIDIVGKICIINNELTSVEKLLNSTNSKTVYEVIRVINKVPLFLEDHLERMRNSLMAAGLSAEAAIVETAKGEIAVEETAKGKIAIEEPAIADNAMEEQATLIQVWKDNIYKLALENNLENFNAKILCYAVDEYSVKFNSILYICKSYYPSENEVQEGLPVDLFKWERSDPNAKILKTDYKAAVSKAISDKDVFEVLLVNNENKISEGSRSNVFFIIGEKVYTSPGNMVLKGVTRKYIIQACQNCGIEVIEEMLPVEMLCRVDGLFISGTSIKVQPVSKIGDIKYSSGNNTTIMRIRAEFENIVSKYLQDR